MKLKINLIKELVLFSSCILLTSCAFKTPTPIRIYSPINVPPSLLIPVQAEFKQYKGASGNIYANELEYDYLHAEEARQIANLNISSIKILVDKYNNALLKEK